MDTPRIYAAFLVMEFWEKRGSSEARGIYVRTVWWDTSPSPADQEYLKNLNDVMNDAF